MLEPQSRTLLLDALRPPAGSRFDCAIGTTFSLDLVSLLMAPLAFTRFDVAATNTSLQVDPMAWLESLRRHADRIGIFCQAGQIAVPPADNRLFGYLERAVVEVSPKGDQLAHRVFHPKVWAIRFLDEDGTVRYRLLCMSRNMTFDRSWDTMLVLDGVATARNRSLNAPLGQFFASLPGLARGPVPEHIREQTELIANEIRTVEFELPAGFTSVAFWPLGIGAVRQWPFPAEYSRSLVVSPFISATSLKRLTTTGTRHTLVGRPDELNRISIAGLGYDSVYTLSQGAEPEETDVDETATADASEGNAVEIEASSSVAPFSGLHAKLYVFEQGSEVRYFTGSANATNTAFGGSIEFLVELIADRRTYGIDSLMKEVDGETRLINLLEKYIPPDTVPEPSIEEILDDLLSDARRQISAASFSAAVTASGETFRVDVAISAGSTLQLQSDIVATCRLVTLKEMNGVVLPRTEGEIATFEPVSYDALTTFVAVELAIEREGVMRRTSFVMNLPTTGLPDDRAQRLLRAMLVDREKFLRFLLLLLQEDGAGSSMPGVAGGAVSGSWGNGLAGTALLESLVQTYERSPEKLDQIERLVSDLSRTEEGKRILPDGFMEIWEPIWEARQMSLGIPPVMPSAAPVEPFIAPEPDPINEPERDTTEAAESSPERPAVGNESTGGNISEGSATEPDDDGLNATMLDLYDAAMNSEGRA